MAQTTDKAAVQLYEAVSEVEWAAAGGKAVHFAPGDEPRGDIPAKALAFFLRCGHVKEVSGRDRR